MGENQKKTLYPKAIKATSASADNLASQSTKERCEDKKESVIKT